MEDDSLQQAALPAASYIPTTKVAPRQTTTGSDPEDQNVDASQVSKTTERPPQDYVQIACEPDTNAPAKAATTTVRYRMVNPDLTAEAHGPRSAKGLTMR